MQAPLRKVLIAILGAMALACAGAAALAQAVGQPGTGVPGPNVNIIGPTPHPEQIPDTTFKQQNEPSCAVQPSNAQNIFCGYNDYRGVDIASIGDAWIGASMSRNGGETWTSRLIPGFPGDTTSLNEAFAADATVAAVPGMALLGFIAAGRDSNSTGGMYLQLWPEENKEDGAPWSYLDTLTVFSGTSGQFVDKPAMLVTLSGGVPVDTALPKGITRKLPPAAIHVAYANFSGNDSNDSASIYYIRSTDYGQSWSNKSKLSESIALNQGAALAANGNTILAVWRQFDKNNNQADSFAYAISTNGGANWSKPATVPVPADQICTFDQPSQLPEANYAFRTKALPSLVSDGKRFYLLWARRTLDEFGNLSCTRGRSRIAYLTTDGTSWDTTIRLVDGQPNDLLSHQFMPAAFAAGGVVEVSWYDTRDDEFYRDASSPAYSPFIVDESSGGPVNRRHTADIYHAQISGGTASAPGTPRGSVKVSQYAVGNAGSDFRPTDAGDGQQLEFNYVNGRLFRQATKPFLGDYNSVAAPEFRLDQGGNWVSNQGALGSDPGPTDPTFHAFWADNRDVRSNVYTQTACLAGAVPGSPECPVSSEYTPANADEPKFLGETGSTATGQCTRDFAPFPAFSPAYCLPPDQEDADQCYARYVASYEEYLAGLQWSGSESQSLKALSRNQNVYSSVIKPGVVFGTASATKPTNIQRAFVVFVRNENSGNEAQTFVLDASPYPVGSGGSASFTQSPDTTPVTSLAVQVPAGSTAARTVFVKIATQALVRIHDESGQFLASVVLNGNPGAGALSDPDCSGKSCDSQSVVAYEGHNPDLIAQAYSVQFPSYRNPSLRNPSLRNSVYESPSLRNQTVEFPSLRNPSLRNSPLDDSSAQQQSYTDFVYDVVNLGNTTSAYTLKPLITGPLADPDGNPLSPELIVSRVYQEETAQNCETVAIGRQQVIVDIGDPDVAAAPPGDQDNNPSTPPNPSEGQDGYDPLADPGLAAGARHGTFFVEPGGRAQVTLRVWGIDAVGEHPEFRNRVWMKVYAQAANTGGSNGSAQNTPAFDVACGTGTENCSQPDVTAPVFNPNPDPDFILNHPQPANVLFSIEANAPGGWKPPTDFAPPAVEDASSFEVVCVDRATGVDVLKLLNPIPVGPAAVVCTATDAAGNVSQPVEYDFIVLDDVPPTVTLDLPPGLDGLEATNPNGEVVNFGATAFDDVNGPTDVTCDPPSGSRFPIGTTTVTCSASDSPPIAIPGTNPQDYTNDEVGTATFTVTVVDRTAPVVTVPADIAVEADGKDGSVVTFSASATDLVSGTIAPTCTPASGSTFAIGSTTVSCTATDGAGNAGSASFKVVVRDTTPPPFIVNGQPVSDTNPLPPITQEATGPSGAIVAYTSPEATDSASPPVTVVCTPESGTLFAIGDTLVTCIATDAAGNQATASFTVTVRDTTPPTLTVPADILAEATASTGAVVAFTANATDVVDGSITPVCTPASGSTFALGATSVTCSARDKAGNSAAASFKVTVRDTTIPTVAPPANVVAEATGPSGAAVSYPAATASDLVGGALAAPCIPVSGSTFAIGTTTVTCTATDADGNTGVGTFTVTVRDTTAPSVTVPANITAEATGASGAVVTYSATATDLVSGSITPVCTPASGGTFAIGTTAVNCSATDAAGNIAGKSFTVTVRDTTPPTLTVPANITTSTGGATATVSYSVTATDAVGVKSLVCTSGAGVNSADLTTGGTFPAGTSTVSCTAKDAAGNASSKSFEVKVDRFSYGGLDGVYANGSKSAKSAVPLDFGFIGAGGSVRVDSPLAAPSVKVYYAGKSCPGVRPSAPTATYPSGSSDYRYSASGFNWQFNWKPSINGLGAGCYYVTVKSEQTGQEFNSSAGPITLTK
jgi:HYR domain